MAKTEQEPILSVNNLKTYFTSGIGRNKLVIKAVDDISFNIYEGEVFGLVGESGCGKTTTGRTIIRLHEPTDGEIYFKGTRIAAGVQSLKRTIRRARIDTFKDKRQLRKDRKQELSNAQSTREKDRIKKEYEEKLQALDEEKEKTIAEAKKEIQARKDDQNRKNEDLMRRMQMIFQDPIASLNPRMTVKEIIAEGLRIAGEKDEKVIKKKVHDVLDTVGLQTEHAERYPHEFSGGQRQRIGVARALVVSPEFIIADEPVSALDVSIQAQVINLLDDLRHELGLTLMFIAHDLSVIKYFSDKIGVMYFGTMVELAPKRELFKNPLHPYTRSLLSAVPSPDPITERKRKRIAYDPTVHDYEDDKPTLHEIKEGHFVHANQAELEEYKRRLK